MQTLVTNLHRFPRESFGDSRELCRRLRDDAEVPPVLFLTCPDAGLLAERLAPKQIVHFHCASALGTVVPPADDADASNPDSLVATIEFALRDMEHGQLVVCGHSPCCTLRTLLDGTLAETRQAHLAWWLERVAPLRELVQSRYAHLTHAAARLEAAGLESVLLSLEHLRGYPSVQERLHCGSLQLHGWFFHRPSDVLFAYHPAAGQFEPLMTLLAERPA